MGKIADFFRNRAFGLGKPPASPQKTNRTLKMPFIQRMFEAANNDRLTGGWSGMPVTAAWIIRQHQRTLVARSREQMANNDYAKAFQRMCRQNIVGPQGVTLQAQMRKARGALDSEMNEALEKSWKKWGKKKHCDITGTQSWRAVQTACINSAAIDGEFMVQIIRGKDAGPFGIALKMLDPQRCQPDYDRFDLPGGAYIRAGIEFNKAGRPVAYHYSVPDESDSYYNFTYAGNNYHRIPADEIIHGFVPDLVGQPRGLPWMATGLLRMRHLVGFENAAIINARGGASKMGFIQYAEGFGPENEDDQPLEISAEPGQFVELPEGASVKEWNPTYPSGEFALFNKAMLRGIASGFGVSYHNLANDLEGVNFSSIRQGTLDEREHWKELQEWLIESLVEPVFEAWLEQVTLRGLIRAGTRTLLADAIDAVLEMISWQARRWAWIDPSADVKAAIASKNSLLTSPGAIIRESGRDPSAVYRDFANDIDEMKAAGIPEEFIYAAILPEQWKETVNADASDVGGTAPAASAKPAANEPNANAAA